MLMSSVQEVETKMPLVAKRSSFFFIKQQMII